MKLHTSLSYRDVQAALTAAVTAGKVTGDVHFVTFDQGTSRSHAHRYEVQLGTYDKTSGPTRSRHYKNSETGGADSVWAATYDEWGWFMAEIFAADPKAQFGSKGTSSWGYRNLADFNAKTHHQYILPSAPAPRPRPDLSPAERASAARQLTGDVRAAMLGDMLTITPAQAEEAGIADQIVFGPVFAVSKNRAQL